MGEPVRVVSSPDPDHPAAQHEHLWLLVGGDDFSDGARAFYLGPDRDIEGDDLARRQLSAAIQSAKSQGLMLDLDDVPEALANHRRSRG
jgi:hypothetical protein